MKLMKLLRYATIATALALSACDTVDLNGLADVADGLLLLDAAMQPSRPTRTFCQGYGVNPQGVVSYSCW
ncbi:MAG TPA: hypothetical protein VEQ62_06070 [Stellaceae bacterium]|jgi:hypothetical protein|nr:hypothetical protein [Stellaceae bacterium]